MTLAILGAGKMGEALARGILAAGMLPPDELTLADVDLPRVTALATELGCQAAASNADAVDGAWLVVLAVKPQIIPAVCRDIAPKLSRKATVLSIAAGVTLKTLAASLNCPLLALARAMPNTPCLVSAGAIGLSFADGAPIELRRAVNELLQAVGVVEEVPESQLDAVTGLSGSGPAYIAVLIEALADGGVLAGLPRATAQRLAVQTVYGTAKLVADTAQHPAAVKDAVSSPGGTTITALSVLEERGFRGAIMDAVRAAAARARELSGE